MMTRFFKLAALGLTLGLAACGTGQQSLLTETLGKLPSLIRGQQSEPLTATRASLQAAGFSDPLIVVELLDEGTRGGLLRAAQKRGVTFWISADNSSSMEFDGGVLRATKGLGYDLYSAETSGARAALQERGPSEYTRVFRHLDGTAVLNPITFHCEMTFQAHETIEVFDRQHKTRRYVELCNATELNTLAQTMRFQNYYWRDSADMTVWAARQWISPRLGYMKLERVFK